MSAESVSSRRAPALSLRGIQTWLQTAITDHEGDLGDATRAASASVGQPALRTEAVATASSRLTAAERVEIYRSMYLARLVEALADDYPTVRHQLGDEAFRKLTARYAARHPSRTHTLARFGDHLADHLAERTDLPDRALLRELARFEAALNRAFDAEPAAPLSRDAFARLPFDEWATTRLIPAPSLELLSLRYAVGRHVAAAQDGLDPPRPRRRATFVAIYQRDWTAR